MITTKNLTYQYTGGELLTFPDLQCLQDQKLLILGNSGCGKTTLLHIMAGLRKPLQGEVNINNRNIWSLSASAIDKYRGQLIGIVFQKSYFIKSLNVEENLKLAQSLAGIKPDTNRIQSILERLNLSHKIHQKTEKLSVGEQQRAAIARAVINKPKVILADEPTSALDDHHCDQVLNLLEQQAKEEQSALVVVTHDKRLKDNFTNHIYLS